MVQDRDQSSLGVLLIIASAAAFSTAGLFTRLIALDVWTVLFWRGIFAGSFIAGYIVWQHRRRTWAAVRAIGVAGLVAAACSTLATICFINALRRTSVADVAVINATLPLLTAVLAWLWTAEQESLATLAASVVAFLGVALMFDAAPSAVHVVGDILAFVMTALLAMMMVVIRRSRQTSMLPAASLSAFACSVAVLPLASPAAALGTDLIYLALFGTAQFGLGLLLLTLGTRLMSATRSALVGALETPLAPIWVWLAFGEIPPLMTCAGGVIVMAAVLANMLLERPKADRNDAIDAQAPATASRCGFADCANDARARDRRVRIRSGRSDPLAGAGAGPHPAPAGRGLSGRRPRA